MPLKNLGLYVEEHRPIVGYSATTLQYKPMQFFIKFAYHNKKARCMQKMYIQQVITSFYGGHYTAMHGFTYLVNAKKAVGIRRFLVNVDTIENDIVLLIEEANRFMYMYCRTDVL